MKAAMAIMARYPVAGKAKTRLAVKMGVPEAVEFYRQCASRIFREMIELPAWITRYVFLTGSANDDEVRDWVGKGYEFRAQSGQNLGIRLSRAFAQILADGVEQAVIIASDVPDISANLVTTSFEALSSFDVVIGPSHDGGYYLIGMSILQKALFKDIRWGSPQVLSQTIARIDDSGLTGHLLPTLIDIDTMDDYNLWRSTTGKDNDMNLHCQAAEGRYLTRGKPNRH